VVGIKYRREDILYRPNTEVTAGSPGHHSSPFHSLEYFLIVEIVNGVFFG
jgi:hypothetical protein